MTSGALNPINVKTREFERIRGAFLGELQHELKVLVLAIYTELLRSCRNPPPIYHNYHGSMISNFVDPNTCGLGARV